jgi:hypothetical protein
MVPQFFSSLLLVISAHSAAVLSDLCVLRFRNLVNPKS